MPRETRYAAGDEMYHGRRVGSGRHIRRRGIRGKTEWGKGVPLTVRTCSGELFETDTVYLSQAQPKYGPFGGVLANRVRQIHCTRLVEHLDGTV